MRYEKTKELYDYWLKLKGERLAPARHEIEPNDIRNLLGDTFILEVNHAAKHISYRLAGTRLCAAHGREMKGLGYLVHWDEEDTVEILNAITGVYSNYTPRVICHLGQSEQNRFMEFETILLPLQPIDEASVRILGLTCPKNIAFWHGAEPIVSHRLRSIRLLPAKITNEEANDILRSTPAMQYVEELQEPDDKRASNGNSASHLTLLKGGKA